jgi:hypothetical protein
MTEAAADHGELGKGRSDRVDNVNSNDGGNSEPYAPAQARLVMRPTSPGSRVRGSTASWGALQS